MIEYAAAAGLSAWINTNGQLLDERAGRRLLAAGCAEVRYSVDGATAATYEHIALGARWDRLIANMRTFRRLRDELRPATIIGLNTVLMRETIDEMDLLWDVFGPDGGRDSHLATRSPRGRTDSGCPRAGGSRRTTGRLAFPAGFRGT